MSSLNDSFLRVMNEGLDDFTKFMLIRLGMKLEANESQGKHLIHLNMTIEVDAPTSGDAQDRVAEFIREQLPWHYAEYHLQPLEIPEGWDSA